MTPRWIDVLSAITSIATLIAMLVLIAAIGWLLLTRPACPSTPDYAPAVVGMARP